MGVLDWFLEQLRPTEIRDLRLSVRIDRTDEGQHLIKLFKQLGDREEPIDDLIPLLRHGYREEIEGPKGPIVYAITEKDRQTLLAIKSMNPVLEDDGTLRFEFAPAILKYLRTKDNLDETGASSRLKIRDEPPQPGMTVDITPHGDLLVKTGYVDEGGGVVLPAESFTKTTDGQYMFGGNSFYRLPEKPSRQVEKLLRTSTSRVPINRVPQFLQRELNKLKKDFSVSLSDDVRQIKIVNDPIQPTAVVDYDPELGLTVDSGFDLGDGRVISPELLSRTSDGAYIISQGVYYALPKRMRGHEKQSLLVQNRVIPKERIPSFMKQQMEILLGDYLIRLSDSAKQIRVLDEPLEPLTKISYDSQEGLEIETGYMVDGNLVPAEQLSATADGGHAIFGTEFVPLPRDLSEIAEDYLKASQHKVSKDEIPKFFKTNLPQLEEAFSVELADSTKAIKILDEPMKPVVVIDFDQQRGLEVQTGYSVEGVDSPVPDSELSKTTDGKYAIFGDTFLPLPLKLDRKAKAYLKRAWREIPTENVPEFFERVLPSLQQAFESEMTAEAQKIQIVDDPLKPVARVEYDPQKGLEVQTGYVISTDDDLVPASQLQATTDGRYAMFGTDFVALPTNLSSVAEKYLAVPNRQIPKEEIPRFYKKDLPRLQETLNVELSDTTQDIQIDDEPLKPKVKIDFDLQQGLLIQTGYELGDEKELSPDSELKKSIDGDYAISDNTFTALPMNLSNEGQDLLWKSRHQVPIEEIPKFLEDLNSLEDEFDQEWTDAASQIEIIDVPLTPTAKVDFDPQQGLTVQAGYDIEGSGHIEPLDQLQRTSDGNYVISGNRFLALPRDLSQAAQSWLEKPFHHIPLWDIPEFFLRDLVLLKNEFMAVLTDLAREIRIIEDPMEPVVNVNKQEGGWLDFNVGYEAGDVSLPQSLFASKVGEDFVKVDDNNWVKVDRETVANTERELKKLEAESTESGFRVPITRFASLEEFIESIGGKSEANRAYQDFIDQLSGFEADETYQLSTIAEADLAQAGISMRPYQRAGVHWLNWLYTNYLHGVLADDMGLGKTLQTICIMRKAYEQSLTRQHSLVLAPKSVLRHWEREFARFYPTMRIYRYHGPARRRDLFQSYEPIVFITTYDTATNDKHHLIDVPFFYLVLDEATYIKNPDAKRTKAVKSFNAAHRLALSGTPVENRPAELWSLFDYLMRGHLGNYASFKHLFEERIAVGNVQATKLLGKRVRPFLMRRKKEDVARDLPDKIEIDEWCSLTNEQKQLYGGLQDEVKRLRAALQRGEHVSIATSILPVLTRLKQICDHPGIVIDQKVPIKGRSEKFDWIVQKINEIHRSGEQTVIFSHFLGMLNFLEKSVRQDGINYIRIDGSTSNRQHLIDQFNEGRAQVALCSLKAAGHGINMIGANHVIHADRWWNPATEDQATDRVHRIGQDKTVYVYRILVENTIEERIDKLLEKKRDIADQIVGAATEGPSQWSREELIDLLSPLDEVEKTRDPSQKARRRTPQRTPDTTMKTTGDEVIFQPKRSSYPEQKRADSDEHQVPGRPTVPTDQAPLSERLVYIVALSEKADEAAVQELVDIIDSPDNSIRWLAGSSLMRIGNPQVVSALSDYLNRHDTSELGQLEAIKVLGKIGVSPALEVLERISSDKNVAEPIRLAAAKSLQIYAIGFTKLNHKQ